MSDKASKAALSDDSRRLSVRIEEVDQGGRWVLVKAESGFWGDPGNTRDVETDTVVHKRTDKHAPMQHSRLLFFLAPDSTSGVFLVEKIGSNGAGSRIVDQFKLDITGAFSKESWLTETVTESSAWSQGAQLLSVRAVSHGFPVDVGDGAIVTAGRIEQILVPDKGLGRYLPFALFQKLRKKEVKLSEVMALPDGVDVDEGYFEVEKNGQTKKYSIDKEGVPAVRVVLNEANQDALTDTVFRNKCLDEVRDLRALEGEPWEESWRTGKWDAKSTTLTFPSAGTS